MGTSISAGTIMAYMDLDMSSFNSAIDMAGEQLSGFASGGVAGALGSIGAAAETAGRALTLGVTAPLMTAAGAAIQTGMQFDASMSNVYGLMSSLNLSQAQMDALRDTAREMGATTKFSASEAADAMGYMALAGWDDAQVIAGIPGVLNLAAAANMDLAKASDIVTDTMTPFGMAAERAGEAADVFAYAQANSNTTVEALGEAMKYAAPTADAFGMTLQDTAAAMGVLANAGIKGSQGGTTLNAMLRAHETAPVEGSARLSDLIRRPQLGYDDLAPFDPERPELPAAVTRQVEIRVKYAGYLQRQEQQIEAFRREEARLLPEDADYASIAGLRLEARQKLADIRPRSIGQAGRISGVSPADIAVLLIWLSQRNENSTDHAE